MHYAASCALPKSPPGPLNLSAYLDLGKYEGTMNPTAYALIFLILFFGSLAAWGLWALLGPGRYNLAERLLYLPVYVLSRVLWRVEVFWSPDYSDAENARRMLDDRITGGAVLIGNHRCSMDPFFVQLVGGRRVHWMVASEYFKAPIFGPLLRSFEAIPTNRGGVDTASTRKAMALARSGRFVGMFPEGRINRTDQPLLTVRPGAGVVALRAGVPLIPIWIEGAPVGPSILSPLLRACRVRIFVGAPDRWGIQNAQTDRGERGLCEQWVVRVMTTSLHHSHQPDATIAMAGKRWVEEK